MYNDCNSDAESGLSGLELDRYHRPPSVPTVDTPMKLKNYSSIDSTVRHLSYYMANASLLAQHRPGHLANVSELV